MTDVTNRQTGRVERGGGQKQFNETEEGGQGLGITHSELLQIFGSVAITPAAAWLCIFPVHCVALGQTLQMYRQT